MKLKKNIERAFIYVGREHGRITCSKYAAYTRL